MRGTPYIGRRYPRVEDQALLRGAGRFVDDLHLPGLLEAAFLRSPTAHGLIRSIDTSAARALPGVHAVYVLADHFACAKLNAALGIDTVHVPYRSSGLAAQDLIGGRLDYLCALGATARQPIETGKARAIALLTADRSPLFPQLTTSKEQRVASVDSYFWSAFLFPKNTPDAIVQRLADASNKTLSRPATVEQLRRTGIEPIAADRRSPAYQRNFTVSEMKTWATR